MTEDQWRTCDDPMALLDYLRVAGLASPCKLRLFAVACTRRLGDRVDVLGQAAMTMAENFADGVATDEQLRAARLACRGSGDQSSWYAACSDPVIAARNAANSAVSGLGAGERIVQANLVREIFGDPFRTFDLAGWLTNQDSVRQRADEIYHSADFTAIRVLGALLEELGCPDANLVEHLRARAAHVKGCWAVDRLLGKE